uniref:PH domain-containing protein n=1 Tax=Syphacia muris TaxID=451379 RepID=A0A0N5B176_9BILA
MIFRFFVLKECFLLYYKISFKRIFEKTKSVDLHPKGIIPLIGCSIVAGQDHGHKNCLLITHSQFKAAIIVCAPDTKSMEMWQTALREATKISYKNTITWERLVKELENRGIMLSEEKRNFEERLMAETQAREAEHSRYLVSFIVG